jgi:cyclopropane-fatty-acyl-phospholipid synthase
MLAIISLKSLLEDGGEAEIWFQRWRVFFMVCAELFGYNNGNEWFVGPCLLRFYADRIKILLKRS